MMKRTLGLLTLALFACGDNDLLRPSPPLALTLVSGDNQEGSAGAILTKPFAVRVTNASGQGIPGVQVSWSVISGEGDLWLNWWLSAGVLEGKGPLTGAMTQTGYDGMARVWLRPTGTGVSTVSASAAAVPGSLLRFTVNSDDRELVVIGFGPPCNYLGDWNPSCYGSPPQCTPSQFTDTASISLGATVEWVYAPAGDCKARIVSVSAPPGGKPFDSGILTSSRFTFVPNVAGDWMYADSINGGQGVLKVR